MRGRKTRWTATLVALLVGVSAGVARGEDWRRLMTAGKLGADLGNHDQASTAFRAVANDVSTPRSLRWEALVRLGLVRSAAGDPEASAEAFRTVLADYADDPEAMHFLTRAVTSGLPGKVWIGFTSRFEELLRTAPVVSSEKFGPGMMPRKVTLSDGDVELSGVWKHVYDTNSGDSYILEVAAYEVDKMLGLDMVPPTVLRALEGEEGSLQLWVYGCETYGTLGDRAPRPPDWKQRVSRARCFDYLIANRDRNVGNMLVDAAGGLVLVDHTRSFSAFTTPLELPERFDRRMIESLRRANRSSLQARLKGLLTEAQIEGVLKRRDILLAHVERLVEERGEQTVLF